MSAVVEAIGDVGEAIGDAVESVGSIAESAVREVGKGAESLGREIGKVGQAAINDPVGTIAKVAAIATQQYWALPLISAGTVVANGGDLGQAAMAAGISYAAMYIAQGVSDYLQSGSESALMGVENAADGSTIFSYSDGSSMIQTADGLTKFTNPTTITGSLNTAISNAAGNVAATALRGGDLNEILMSGLTGGAGTYVGLETTQGLKELGLAAPIANVLGSTSGAVTKGLLSGQDASQVFNTALINNIISTSLAQTGNAIKNSDVFKTLQNSVNEKINEFKDSFNTSKQKFLDELNKNDDLVNTSKEEIASILDQSNKLKSEVDSFRENTLLPSQQTAQNAYNTAVSSYNDYKSKSDEFSRLVAEYDAAKAAENFELANSLADQANALIPSLNSATDQYNADFNVYETAKNDFDAKNQTYTGYIEQFKNLDTQYAEINKRLQDQAEITKAASAEFNQTYDQIQKATSDVAKQVDTAYETASKYDPIAKDTFKDIYTSTGDLNRAVNLSEQVNSLPEDNQKMYEFAKSFGLRPEDAIEFAPDLAKMSLVANQTFYDSLAKNPDAAAALNIAKQVNELPEENQTSFYDARLKGLDTDTALNVANVVGNRSKEEQQLYIDSIRSGLGPQLADILSAAYGLTGRGTELQDVNAINLANLKTPEAKEAYQVYVTGGINPDEAFALSKGQDYAILSQGTGTQFASTTGDYSAAFADTHAWDPVKQQWVPIQTEGQPTGGIGGGAGTGVGVSGTQSYKPLTKEEIDQFRAEGVPEDEIKKLAGQYGIAPEQYTSFSGQPYYQQLIDELFTKPSSKAKTIAKQPATGTTTGGPGTPSTTTTTPTGGTTTGGTTPGGATGTQPTGGTTTGGTDQTGGGGTGTGGTGTGGTGTGGGGTGTGGGGFGIGGIGGGGFAIPAGMYGMYGLYGQDQYGGIKNLTAGLTERMDYNLSGLPSDQDTVNPMYNAPQIIPQMATGGLTSSYDPFSTKDTSGGSSISSSLSPSLTRAQINYILTGLPDYLQGKAEGGQVEGHNPQFYSEGGLSSIENRFVKGDGDGTSDSIPAMLADGEFVIPADVVSSLGNGSNDAGASVLDEFLKVIREHKRKADAKSLPEDSKGPLAYLIDAQRRAKA